MRLRTRVRKVLAWGVVALAALVAAALGFAYSYVTDSDTLAALVRRQVPRYLPGSRLKVDRVQLRPLVGDVELKMITVRQVIDGSEFSTLHVPWLRVQHDFRALLHGRFEPRRVDVAQPKLRLCRRRDGTWNLQGFLADPWPGPPLPTEPDVVIRNGTVELIDDRGAIEAILREVDLDLNPTAGGPLRFHGTARGGPFERLKLEGTFDRATGRVALSRGDLERLEVKPALLRKLPAGWRDRLGAQVGQVGGEVDISLARLAFDPAAGRLLGYAGTVAVRGGHWECPKVPFPLDDVAARLALADGVATIQSFSGRNGKTKVRARGTLAAGGPMDLAIEVDGLELDERLKAKTPPNLAPLWDDFQPRGRVDVAVRANRRGAEDSVIETDITCLDVAGVYRLFRYPVEHVRGTIKVRPRRVEIDLTTPAVGGESLTCRGTVLDAERGKEARVALDFAAAAVPLDAVLMKAMPPDVVETVRQFHPVGSARGTAKLRRVPAVRADEDPEVGHVTLDIDMDLNPGCSMMWDGLKYPVRDLLGHLAIRPDGWTFTNMRGRNGQAQVAASGRVRLDAQKRFDVKLGLEARHLDFDENLRQALPPQWQDTWALLNPRGSSRVVAEIDVGPGRPDRYHLKIHPEKETRIKLVLTPAPAPGQPRPAPIALPRMEEVTGEFTFDKGAQGSVVRMSGVQFLFRESPVTIRAGRVDVGDDGRFALKVEDLEVTRLRLDSDLRAIMPPVMAQFCNRIDNGRPFRVHGDLGIAWSGQSGQPAVCSWKRARVFFNDNGVQAGVPLEHLQGEASNLHGWSDGRTIVVEGALSLDSAIIQDQQVTKLESPIVVRDGKARLTDIRGGLLGGTLRGTLDVSLDDTPQYSIKMELQGADLERYARTLPSRQALRGTASGWVDLSGLGNDLHSLRGEGAAAITRGELGRLPFILKSLKLLRLAPATPIAFDSADVSFQVQSGVWTLHPIRFTGDAISLLGHGTVDLQGELDLRFQPLAGRDERHVPGVSDALREFFGQFYDIRVTGPIAMPRPALEPLPTASRLTSRLAEARARRARPGAAVPALPRRRTGETMAP